ncbi:Imm21 family immunity protein [Luteibacter aegosomatissinici]|uniref:Imm21 family immunity protein n=1 Tax=Luteibacter aegosomatissinici TaxID=2911539 RepID=UPI001FF891B0|nr:Imm21 family immunity protein [Luteibacter aegosomatissinici]UPG93908.1 immunity 21 family protein [Luteibacter aegosomatissinici]
MSDLPWIASEGGPLVFMHRSLLGTWRGVSGTVDAGATTDYERACAVDDELGVLGGTPGILVLGDEPDATSLRQFGDATVIVRWRSAPSAALMETALSEGLGHVAFVSVGPFHTIPGEHVLFDSACARSDMASSIVATLTGTSYELATAMLVDDRGVSALLHRLSGVG